MRKIVLTLILLLIPTVLPGQENNPDLEQARAFFDGEEWEKAVDFYERGKRASPYLKDDLDDWAIALLQLDRNAEAVRLLRNILEIDSTDSRARFNLGVAYFNSGVFDQARLCFRRLARKYEDNSEVTYLLGMSEIYCGNHQEAWEILTRLSNMDEDRAAILLETIMEEDTSDDTIYD